MTMPNKPEPPMNSKLRSILSDYRLACILDEQKHFDKPEVKDLKWLQRQYEIHETEAEKAIRQAVGEEMLVLVGKDEKSDDAKDFHLDIRNQLRQELRQKTKDWSEADIQEQSNIKESE